MRRIAREAAWVVAAMGVQFVGQALLIRLLTQVLSRRQYGVIILANSVVSLLQLIVFAPIIQGTIRLAPQVWKDGHLSDLVRTAARAGMRWWRALAVIALALGAAALVTRGAWSALTVLAVLPFAYGEYRSARSQALLNTIRKRSLVAAARGFDILARAALVAAVGVTLHHPSVAMLAIAVAAVVVAHASEVRAFGASRSRADGDQPSDDQKAAWLSAIRVYAVPLAFASIATWVQTSSDRWVCERYLGLESAAILGAASQIGNLPFVLVNGVMQSTAFPVLYARADSDPAWARKWILRTAGIYLVVAIAAWCALFLARRLVVSIVLAPQLRDAHELVPLLAAGWLLFHFGQALALAMMTLRTTERLLLPNAVGAAAQLAACMIGIRFFGIQGCGVALIVSSLLRAALIARGLRERPQRISNESTNSENPVG